MMLRLPVICAIGPFLLAGCTASSNIAAPDAVSSVLPTASVPAGFQLRNNDLVHIQSGMTFPLRVGEAELTGAHSFADTGEYVGLGYAIPLSDGSTASVRIGMVQLPAMTAHEHYLSRRPIVLARIGDASPLQEGPLPDLKFDNFCGRFSDGSKVEGLITAQLGNWGARAETEYSLAREAEAHTAVASFLAALDWHALPTS